MATKNARGRTTLTELKRTTVDERGAEHIGPGIRATTTRTTHYAFMSDGSVLRRYSYKVQYSGMPEGHSCYRCVGSSDSGTWQTKVPATDTRRDLNRKTMAADKAKLVDIIAKHAPLIESMKSDGYVEVRGAR